MRKGFIVAGWYNCTNNGTVVNYTVRFTDKTKKVFTLERKPYFYIPKDAEISKELNLEIDDTSEYIGIDGVKLKKVYTKYPFEVRNIRSYFPITYEADIPFVDRVRYDMGIKGWVDENFNPISEEEIPNLRTLFLDIEADDSHGFPNSKRDPVLVICMYDNYTGTYITLTTEQEPVLNEGKIVKCKSEAELRIKFNELIRKINPDIITGWNVVDFDIEYLSTRFGIDFKEYKTVDLLETYMKLHENDVYSYSLDYIAKMELGKGKTKRHKKVADEWKSNTLSDYCLNDVKLCVELDRKLKLIEFLLGISTFTGCRLDNCLYNSKVADAYLFFEIKGNVIQKTASEEIIGREDILTGATVIDPKPGIYEWVAEIDNASEYPNIIRSWNLGPDGFGVFPKTIEKLMKLRTFYKNKYKETHDKIYDDKQRVTKFLINSFAGILGFKKYRNYSPDIFNKITGTARKHLQWNAEFFRARGFDVLYGDTDSVYVHLKKPDVDINKLVSELNDSFSEFFRLNGGDGQCYLETKLENIYRKILFMPVKKRYAGITVNGEFKVRGFEIRRSNVAKVTVSVQDKVLRWLLEGDTVKNIKDKLRKEIVRYPLIEFGVPCAIRKNEYTKSIPQHVRAAEWSNKNIGKSYGINSKFLMFFVKGMDTDVIAIDYNDDDLLEKFRKNIDIRRQIERTIVMPMESIFDVVGRKCCITLYE